MNNELSEKLKNNELSDFELSVMELVDSGKFKEEYRIKMDKTLEDRRDCVASGYWFALFNITEAIKNIRFKEEFNENRDEVLQRRFDEDFKKKIIKFNSDTASITKPYDGAMEYIRKMG